MNKMNSNLISKYITDWIKDYCSKHGITSLVIGISGGIDSALTSTLCAKTNIKTIVISMPIHQNKKQLNLAKKHISWLKKNYSNIENIEIDLSNVFDVFKNIIPNLFKNDLSLANSRARLRMMTLYQIAASKNGIVVGTGNKIEDFCIGFFTKYGDGGVDINPIGDLLKSEVREIANALEINKSILEAKPTDGLWDDNRTDEQQLNASYEELEWAMKQTYNAKKIDSFSTKERQILTTFYKHNNANKHKMNPIPVCNIPLELK